MEIGGLDTETPEGNLALICTDDGYIETEDIHTTLEFLTREEVRSKIYFTFNLRFDAQAIIKQIPVEYWEGLWTDHEILFDGYKIFYIPKKLLSIGRRKHNTKLYDIAQFYKGYSLDSASKQFLNESKDEKISAEKIGESRKYYENNIGDIINYSKKDALLTKKLGLLSKEKFEKLGVDFSNPISPASLFAYTVKEKYDYPIIPKGIETYHQVARRAFRGGYFQTMQRGFFDQPLYDYDINSAYPSNMSQLPHWGNGRFIFVDEEDKYPTEYGWILAEFDCPYIPYNTKEPYQISYEIKDTPVNFLSQNTKIVYPSGIRKQIITKIEFDWMKKNGFNPKFMNGIYWVKYTDKYISPFAWIPEFYKERLRIKKIDFPMQWSMKIYMNGGYGKTAQYRHGEGILTNFFYASYITAMTRIKVADVVERNKSFIINVATDGLLSTKKLDLPLSENLGEWDSKEYSKGLIIGNGILQLWNSDGTFKTKARGITENTKWNMYEAIKKEADKDKLKFIKKSPVQLGEIMMMTKKLKPMDLNVFIEKKKEMKVNCDVSNDWSGNYLNFQDLLDNKTVGKPLQIENIKPKKVA